MFVRLVLPDVHTYRACPSGFLRIGADIAGPDCDRVVGADPGEIVNCPNCRGVLWEMDNPDVQRYRCHTGHSFTVPALLASQSEKIEETLWASLRMFEERKNLLNNLAHKEGHSKRRSSAAQREKETQVHIERIRAILLAPQSQSWESTLAHVKKVWRDPGWQPRREKDRTEDDGIPRHTAEPTSYSARCRKTIVFATKPAALRHGASRLRCNREPPAPPVGPRAWSEVSMWVAEM
jgi:hypothetical protein